MQPDTSGIRSKLADLGAIGAETRTVERQMLNKAMALHDEINQRLGGDLDDDERARLLEERGRVSQVIAKAQHALGET